jgi:hypothetical protein
LTNKEEMDALSPVGGELAWAAFRDVYVVSRRAGLGRKHQLPQTRRAAYDEALRAALTIDPHFRAEAPSGWFDEQ